jgi:ribonuclease BN (tRNA processing enzyme)
MRAAAETSAYDKYAEKGPSKLNDVLVVLKGWSSATPITASSNPESFGGRECRGGGYFIKAAGHGMILDPGHDFLRNFREARLHIREVDSVIVTHNHPDHQGDLTRIANLHLEYRNRLKPEDRPMIRYWLDADTNATLRDGIVALGVDGHDVKQANAPTCPESEEQTLAPFGKTMLFGTKHGDGKTVTCPFGCMFDLPLPNGKSCTVGYTSDTVFFTELPKHVENADVLICHFGSARVDEYRDENAEGKHHLGYNGLSKLIDQTRAKLYIISEFWGGIGDQRYDLVEALRRKFKDEKRRDISILPGDIGLVIDLKTLGVYCSECREPTPCDRIRVLEPTQQFDLLRYYCPNCPTGKEDPWAPKPQRVARRRRPGKGK